MCRLVLVVVVPDGHDDGHGYYDYHVYAVGNW